MNPSRLLVVIALTVLSAIAQDSGGKPTDVSASPAVKADKERLLRKIHFGNRELHLPSQLQNDELQVANDGLENDTARLEGQEQDSARITIDRYLVEQTKAAIQISNSFALVWSKDGDKELQRKLSEAEAQFDIANDNCHPHSESGRVRFERLEEAEAACASLHQIYVAVSRYQINTTNVPSIFKDDAVHATRTGYKLLMADSQQLKLDMAGRFRQDVKKALINNDQALINMDRMIWLQEILHADTIQFNAKHPEHPMADTVDLVKMTLQLRQQIATLNAEERRKLLGLPSGGR
jgi:hypothetical protein